MNLKLFFNLFLLLSIAANAQTEKVVNTTDFILECSKFSGMLPKKQIVIWFPNELWSIIGKQLKLTDEVSSAISNEMKDYLMFAVIDYTLENGKVTFKSKDEIDKTIELIDANKKSYKPLIEENLPDGAKNIIQSLRPVMASFAGQLGEGMDIVIFNKIKTIDNNVLELNKKASFSLQWESTKLNWNLPLNSVLPSKFCAVDNEEMKATWIYCPKHGNKL